MFCEWREESEKKQEDKVCRHKSQLMNTISQFSSRGGHLLGMRETGLSKRLEDPKDLNNSFKGMEGKAKDKQKKLKTQILSKMEKR